MRPSSSPRLISSAIASLSLVLLTTAPAHADLRVASWIGEHMVIQEGRSVVLWGTDAPGTTVRAALAGAKVETRADASGRWRVELPALRAGGPYPATIEGTSQVAFHDVFGGEVWIASGQSNMEFPLSRSRGGQAASADGCPGVRLFLVDHKTALQPATEVQGEWQRCDPSSADGFSAVAFHFARELHRALGVPIGIVQTTWGGTPAESWTPRETLVSDPSLAPLVTAMDATMNDPSVHDELVRRLAAWEAKNFHPDLGNRGEALGFARPGGGGTGWSSMDLPQLWENAGLAIDGAVWFRREVDVPSSWSGQDLRLSLGAIDDFDVTYWNGERVGAMGAETPASWSTARHYVVPGRLVKPGKNLVAVRVFDRFGQGGFAGSRAQMTVGPVSGGAPIALSGAWSYRIERRLEPIAADFGSRPTVPGPGEPASPTVLWNAMVAPLAGMPVAGVLWYQGESNVSRADQYRALFPAMIWAWRAAWRDPGLPFLFVQLPNYAPPGPARPLGESSWAELREAQTAALREPRTAMAVTLDVGEGANLHPLDKEDVGHRLALWAQRTLYGEAVIASGPALVAVTREGTGMRALFQSFSAGLDTPDGAPPRGFLLAGADRVWHPADARIEGDSVVVSTPTVPVPVAMRYGWGDDPPNTLRSQADLPAAPFRTDDWATTSPKP